MVDEKIEMPDALPFGLIPTLNKMGYMTSYLDEFSKQFIDFSATQKQPALEIGAAYGIATTAALKKGAKVFANDIDKRHLNLLYDSLPSSLKQNCTLIPGRFPDDLDVPDNLFSCILICRVIHFMSGDELMEALRKSYNLLEPTGKLFIIAETPYLKNWENFIPVYEQKLKEGIQFPGLVETQKYSTHYKENLPDFMNLMDKHVLKRVLEETGFKIENLDYINRHYFPDTIRYDGRESVGAIATKP